MALQWDVRDAVCSVARNAHQLFVKVTGAVDKSPSLIG